MLRMMITVNLGIKCSNLWKPLAQFFCSGWYFHLEHYLLVSSRSFFWYMWCRFKTGHPVYLCKYDKEIIVKCMQYCPYLTINSKILLTLVHYSTCACKYRVNVCILCFFYERIQHILKWLDVKIFFNGKLLIRG